MTIQQMHTALDVSLQKLASFALDNFLPQEVDLYLNRAQEKYIKDRLFAEKVPGYQTDRKHLEDLFPIIKLGVDLTVTKPLADYYAALPTDYLYFMQATALVQPATSTIAPLFRHTISVLESTTGSRTMENPFAKSLLYSPKAQIGEGSLKVFAGEKFILKGVALDYVRQPRVLDISLSQSSELPTHTHQEIVDLARQMMLESIESPRYLTTLQENKLTP